MIEVEPIHHSILAQQVGELGNVRGNAPSFIPRQTTLGSQTWFNFFNGRCGSPAALPVSAPFFFESKTARLMFVRRCWPQGFL